MLQAALLGSSVLSLASQDGDEDDECSDVEVEQSEEALDQLLRTMNLGDSTYDPWGPAAFDEGPTADGQGNALRDNLGSSAFLQSCSDLGATWGSTSNASRHPKVCPVTSPSDAEINSF